MNKKEIQKRVLQNGKPLALSKFNWDEETRTFSSIEHNLTLDFYNTYDCTFKTGSDCTFNAGYNCTFKTGYDCTFKTGSDCTFNAGYNCTFNAGSYCTFNAGYNCTFKVGRKCTFNAGYDCTFDTGSDCTFDTGSDCTFDTGERCVIVRRDEFEVIQPKENEIIQLCPREILGYLSNGLYNGEPHVIVDGILSKVISKKGNVSKVINHGETETSYIVEKNGLFAHGATIKEAKEDIIYKISNRDTSKYDDFTLSTTLTKEEAIEMYMVITGACSQGTKYFVNNNTIKDELTVQEVIDITKGQYSHNLLTEFFKS